MAIPLFNEEAVLPELLKRLRGVLDRLPGGPHEIVFVDDGSHDRTLSILEQAALEDPRIMVVEFSRNFGHQAAITAGLDHVTGAAVVVMDGDLQDAPEEIPKFLEYYEEGYDVVFAKRVGRKEGLVLRSAYYLAYRLISALSEIELPMDAGDFALLSRRVVERVRALPEQNRYLRGLRAWVGFRQIGIEVERAARGAGTSKYSVKQLFKLALDGVFSFSTVPLRVASVLGLVTIFASGLYALYAVAAKLLWNQPPHGFTALIVALTLLAGVQLLFLGVVGEYVGRIYQEVKRRPHYVVTRTIRRD